MERWEYFTTHIESNMANVVDVDSAEIPPGNHPKYSPYALIPELNRYGAKGWELISIQPVSIGKNHDVIMPDGSIAKWGRHYFCTFKRRIGSF